MEHSSNQYSTLEEEFEKAIKEISNQNDDSGFGFLSLELKKTATDNMIL